MTASIAQASCTMDAVVCDDTGVVLTPTWLVPLGTGILVVVVVAVVLALAPRRRR